jgi:hypothetical protein
VPYLNRTIRAREVNSLRGITIFLNIWAAVGPLLGIFGGAYLTRLWQRKQWLADNRKEECRELLSAIAKSADALLEARSQIELKSDTTDEAVKAVWAENRECMILFQDRIFTAKKLEENKLFTTWHDASVEFLKNGDRKKLGAILKHVNVTIVDIALNG